MGSKDVRDALVAMEEDESVRARLADGDFGAVPDLELSADEQTLVRDAANDMPDVAGFASDYLLEIDGIKGESSMAWKLDALSVKLGDMSMKWNAAWKYGKKI
jgi:hypothetical protein